jgi:hypothetical protein
VGGAARLVVRRSGAAEGAAGAPDNKIGEAGAVALAEALESGQCALTSLDLSCESCHACAGNRMSVNEATWMAPFQLCLCARVVRQSHARQWESDRRRDTKARADAG